MKASLVAYDIMELHKKSKLKVVKIAYVKDYPKWQSTQISLLQILGVKIYT
jgi:hypothetical protein